jgi:hypothetical protein
MNLVKAWRVGPCNLITGVVDTVRNHALGY